MSKPRLGLMGLAALLVLLVGTMAWAQTQVLSLTDIHYDPFADPSLVDGLSAAPADQWQDIFASSPDQSYCTYGGETNYALLTASLEAMRAACPDPAFAVFPGDIITHSFEAKYEYYTGDTSQDGLRSFIKKTVEFVFAQISAAYPDTPIYFSLGNEDAYEGDYDIAPQGQFLADSGALLAESFLTSQADRDALLDTYTVGGYYSLALPGENQTRVIGINSIFFSKNHPGFTGLDYNPAQRQLDWLAGELEAADANGEKVWVLSHIPPGMNMYGTVSDSANSLSHMTVGDTFWHQKYVDEYLSLVRQYPDTVAATLSGHTHMDDFRLIYPEDLTITPVSYVHISPAMTPLFGNNPGFKVFSVEEDDLAMTGATAYHLDLAQSQAGYTQSYSLNQAYRQAGLDRLSLKRVRDAMLSDQTVRTTYMGNYYSQSTNTTFQPPQLLAFWVGQGAFSGDDFVRIYNVDVGKGVLAR